MSGGVWLEKHQYSRMLLGHGMALFFFSVVFYGQSRYPTSPIPSEAYGRKKKDSRFAAFENSEIANLRGWGFSSPPVLLNLKFPFPHSRNLHRILLSETLSPAFPPIAILSPNIIDHDAQDPYVHTKEQ